MATAVTQVGKPLTFGNMRGGIYSVVFSGNYATGGEAITPSKFGLTTIEFVLPAPAIPTSLASTEPTSYNPATGKLLFFEGAGANAALLEKQNAEAYVAGTTARLFVLGS